MIDYILGVVLGFCLGAIIMAFSAIDSMDKKIESNKQFVYGGATYKCIKTNELTTDKP